MSDDFKRLPPWMRCLIWIAVILTVPPLLLFFLMFVGGFLLVLVAR